MKTIKVNYYNVIPKNFTGIAEYSNGTKVWFQNGEYHREMGPCTSCTDCLKGNFKLCLKPGPAFEYSNGGKKWFINGNIHREVGPCTSCTDCLKGNFELCSKPGPAVERSDGTKFWFQNGVLHRENGPAIEWSDGYRQWFINGERISEISFKVFQLCLEKK